MNLIIKKQRVIYNIWCSKCIKGWEFKCVVLNGEKNSVAMNILWIQNPITNVVLPKLLQLCLQP